MLTFVKQIFIWWHRQTLGTFLKTLFFGRYVGSDTYGNKYYKSKKDERWVIYSKDIEATKITSDWFLWIHHTTSCVKGPACWIPDSGSRILHQNLDAERIGTYPSHLCILICNNNCCD